LPWRFSRSVHGLVSPLSARYFRLMAMEKTPSLSAFNGKAPLAFILGTHQRLPQHEPRVTPEA
jgi:hypothetical protein